jgi:hypothetical protein
MKTEAQTALTTQEVADQFQELAQQEKWFEIQDQLFSEDVRSIEPTNSLYLTNEEGKSRVRKKAEDFVSKIEEVHRLHTTSLIISGNHFTVGRIMDLTVKGYGRVKIDEIMLYEVKDGQIVSEQFFY